MVTTGRDEGIIELSSTAIGGYYIVKRKMANQGEEGPAKSILMLDKRSLNWQLPPS